MNSGRSVSHSRLRNASSMFFKLAILSLALGVVSLSPPPSPPGLLAAQRSPVPVNEWEYAVSFSNRIVLYNATWHEVGQTAQEFSQITSLIYDEIDDRIYFTVIRSENNGSIYSLGRDPHAPSNYVTLDTVVDKIHEEEYIRGLAFDPIDRCLYWIDEHFKRIYKLDVKQPNAQPVIWLDFDEEIPQAISVDVCRRFLYWTTDNDEITTIERASLDVNRIDSSKPNKRTVLIQAKMEQPISLDIDQFSNRMFWIDNRMGSDVAVESADLHGNNRTMLYEGSGKKFRSLIVDENSIFVVDYGSECVVRLNKTGNATPELLARFKSAPRGIIKRPRLIENHDDHPICRNAVYQLKEQVGEKEGGSSPPTTDLSSLNFSNVICLNGKVNGTGLCECYDGWSGVNCERKVCFNYCFHGKCAVASTGYPLCRCEPGFVGERCEVDLCAGYCLNGGHCKLEEGEPVCQCASSYLGRRCEMINSVPVICRAHCEGMAIANVGWSIEEECSCGNSTAAEPLCSVRMSSPMGGPYFIYVIVGAVLLTIVLIVIMVLGAIRRWYTPARPKIKKTYVVRKNVTPMTYRPAPTERCEITIENCCNMEYCDTPCFDPKILVKDGTENEGSSPRPTKDDKRDLLSNIVLDNNSDLF